MTNLWLIANSMSSTTEESVIAETREAIEAHIGTIARMIDLSEEQLPPDGRAPDIIACLGGDGTANAVIKTYACDDDAPDLLILPGGTMNLLAAKLHGDAGIVDVIEKAGSGARRVSLPQIEGPDFRSLVGIIAGPTAHWGDVREDIRKGAIGALVEHVPAALEATFNGARVTLKGESGEFAALFIEPREDGLHAHDIVADNIGDLALHGWAWLNRDFLGGPTEELTQRQEMTVESDDAKVALLADGEHVAATAPLTLKWRKCPARFIATISG